MELAGRYFGTGFGSSPMYLMMQGTEEPEMPTTPFQTMGAITSERSPSPLKPADYMLPKKESVRFMTDTQKTIQRKKAN